MAPFSLALSLSLSLSLLLFLVAFSSARTTLPLPDDQTRVSTIESTDSTASDFDSKPIILLPSEKPDSDPQPTHDQFLEHNSQSVPLRVISFRPIHRNFPLLPLPLRRGPHCHHRHDHRFRPRGPAYGNDMIMSDEDLSLHSVVPRDPQNEPEFEHGNDLEMRNPGHPHPHPHPHHHHHHHHHRHHDHDHYGVDEDGDEREWSWQTEEHDGFMSKLRKFLNF